jgi:hypothetical protein
MQVPNEKKLRGGELSKPCAGEHIKLQPKDLFHQGALWPHRKTKTPPATAQRRQQEG